MFNTQRSVTALATLLTTMGFAAAALAQEEGEELEEIVVTGSYIYSGVDSPSPVTVISGEELLVEAPQDMLTYFFTNVPQNFSSDLGQQTGRNGQPRLRGGGRNPTINLRGIGNENTLTLLNGRRTIANPAVDGQGWPSTSINSLVPRIAVQRVETLMDGAAATFGSDPVAGVVNFITNNDFRGFDVLLETRVNEVIPDAANHNVGAIWGGGNDSTNFVVAFEHGITDRITLDQIEGEDDPDPDVTPETGTGLDIVRGLNFDGRRSRGVVPTWVDPDCGNPAFGPPLFAKYPAETSGEFTRETTLDMADSCAEPTGYNPGLALQNDIEQSIAFVSLTHRFNESLTANVEVNHGRQRIAETDYWGDSNASAWVFPPVALGPTFAIPNNHPGVVRARDLTDGAFGTVPGRRGPVPVAIFQEGETLPFNSTLPSFTTADLSRVALALDGAISGSWEWHLDLTSANYEVQNGLRDMVVGHYELAINGYGGADCGVTNVRSPANPAPGTGNCHWYNPFMSSALPDAAALGLANDPDMVEWLTPNRVDIFEATFWSADFLVTGDVGELPAGPAGLAVGAAIRSDELGRDADELANTGQLATAGTFSDWHGSQEVSSLFVELALPLADNVNMQVAARNESYDGGFSQTTPKIAVNWTPTDELTLRGSYGQSFRGPSIVHSQATQIFTGMNMRNVPIDHDMNPNTPPQSFGMGGGLTFPYELRHNPDVGPQTADNLSAGFDYDITDRVSVGASWIAVEFQDRIVSPTAPTVMNSAACLNTDANGIPILAAGDITYVPVEQGGCAVALDPLEPLNSGNLQSVVGYVQNLGYLDAEFLDVRASMVFNAGGGTLRFTPSATFTTKYEFPNSLDASGVDFLCEGGVCNGISRNISATTGMGGGFNGVTSMPRWQANLPLNWNLNSMHSVRLTANYRDSLNAQVEDLTEAQLGAFNHEEGQWTLNGNYTWNASSGISLSFFVNNIFSTDPPATQGQRFNRRQREYGLRFRYSQQN